MTKIANSPLGKRNKEHYENLKVEKTWMTSTMDKKELEPLWLKWDARLDKMKRTWRDDTTLRLNG